MRYPDPTSRAVIVIPTYNEADNIPSIIERLLKAQPQVEALIVDDGSPDGTGELADQMAAADDRVHVIHRTVKEGLGAAYIEGFRWALEQGYDVIGEMDADGSHQPEQLHRLLDVLPRADLVIGSRYVQGGSVVNWPKHRELLSRGGNVYTRLLLGISIRDVTAGFRVFHADTLRAIELDLVESVGYVFQAELAYRTLQQGMMIREVPIAFIERERGHSKMSSAVARESLRLITQWGLSERMRRRRRSGNKSPSIGR